MANLVQMLCEWLSPNAWVHWLIDDLAKRLHHELAFVHVWVRNNKAGFVHVKVVVEQDIDVYQAVVILSVDAFCCASQGSFNALRSL